MSLYYDQMYLDMAQVAARYSRAEKLKVGCVIVKNRQIISVGINGTPCGWHTNVCEDTLPDGSLITKREVLHAEQAALLKLSKSTLSSDGASMYITHSPCAMCANMIKEAGIVSVHYHDDYRSDVGSDFLRRCGVDVTKVMKR